jgi:hypothetical protein
VLWILGNPMIAGSSTHQLGHLSVSIAFAALYFATFSVALVLAAHKLRRHTTLSFALLNWAALVAILCFEYSAHDASGLALALGLVALSSGVLALLSSRQDGGRVACEIQLVLAAATLALAVGVGASGVTQMVLAWSGASLLTLAGARALRMRVLARASVAILGLAFVAQLPELSNLRLAGLLALTTMAHHAIMRATQERNTQLGSARATGHSFGYAAALTWLTLCSIATGVPDKLVVLCWLAAALALVGVGSKVREFSYRMAGFAVFAISFGRLFLVDMASMASGYRIVAFIVLGLMLLGISYASASRASNVRSSQAKDGEENQA